MKNLRSSRCIILAINVVFFFSGICSVGGQAAARVATELALFEEIPIVYTPARKEQLVSEAPASTRVLTSEDIRLYGGINIYDALRQVSGVNVMAGTVSQPGIAIRGLNEMTANSTLLLVDGRNVYLQLQGIFLWETIPIQPDEIKQIEIVKGPVASLYGANAFNGMINIITKSPEEINGTIISGKSGTENTYIGSMVHGQKLGDLGYKLSLGWRQFDSFEEEDYKTDLGKLNAEVELDLSDTSRIALSGGMSDGKFPYITDSIRSALGDYDGTNAYGKLDYSSGGFETKFFWNHVDAAYISPMMFIEGRIESYELESKHNFDLGERHSITIGGGGRYDVAESNIYPSGIDEKSQTLWNIYLQDEFEITDTFRLVGSGRIDHHSIADYNLTGRVAGIFNPAADHLIRVSVGNSFRAPTLSEYFIEVPYTTPDSLGLNRGNEDLDVETILTTELGYQGFFLDKKLKFSVDVFWSEVDDLIDNTVLGFTSLFPPIVETLWSNLGQITTWGIEPGIEAVLADWLTGFANYSYQDADFKDGAYTRFTPEHKANLGLKARFKDRLVTTIYGHYVSGASEIALSPSEVDSYFLLNARIGYQVSDHVEIAVAGSNLLDDRHREAPAGEEIGMRIVAQASVKF